MVMKKSSNTRDKHLQDGRKDYCENDQDDAFFCIHYNFEQAPESFEKLDTETSPNRNIFFLWGLLDVLV